MGFWPYFLHEYSSGGMSAILALIAGTLMVLFTRFFLLLEQWQRLPLVVASECAPAQGFRLWPDSGGLPEDTRLRPLDTLPSPAVTEEKKDVEVTDVAPPDTARFGFVKSRVRLWGCAAPTGATTCATGRAGAETAGGGTGGGASTTGPRRKRAWPVRSRMEMTLRNLETAWSAISPIGGCEGGFCSW
uniref:Uncharacterized protein n=1 Tax=Zea mays TaxID=4577 RepID=C4J414_MAIZE|nr:unknown [Zea mays]ACR36763.1 unknown [Zea mays]